MSTSSDSSDDIDLNDVDRGGVDDTNNLDVDDTNNVDDVNDTDVDDADDLDETFRTTYACYPIVNENNKKLERGGLIQLPESALDEIEHLGIRYPLMFKLTNDANNHFTHAGVIDFDAEEGQVNVPLWIMTHLGVKPGDRVTIRCVSLPAATYCRIEPLTRNFANISDIETVLECNFHHYFACLTEGDILSISERDQNEIHKIKIVETRPESAVNILNCDVELEVSIPVPEKPKVPVIKEKIPVKEINRSPTGFRAFQGQGYRLGKKDENSPANEEPPKNQSEVSPCNETGCGSKSVKRKSETTEEEPQNKKKCVDNSPTYNEIVFIREGQKSDEPSGNSDTETSDEEEHSQQEK